MSVRINGIEYYSDLNDYLEEEWLIEDEDELNIERSKLYPFLSRDMKHLEITEYFFMDKDYVNEVFIEDINDIILRLHDEYIKNYDNPVVYYHDETGIVIEDIDNLKRTRNGNIIEDFINLSNDDKTPIEILYELLHIFHGNIELYKESSEYNE